MSADEIAVTRAGIQRITADSATLDRGTFRNACALFVEITDYRGRGCPGARPTTRNTGFSSGSRSWQDSRQQSDVRRAPDAPRETTPAIPRTQLHERTEIGALGRAERRHVPCTVDLFARGTRDELIGKIQERKGIARDKAEKEVNEWASSL